MLERVAARDAWSASVLNIELIRFVCMLVRPGLGWAGLGWAGLGWPGLAWAQFYDGAADADCCCYCY